MKWLFFFLLALFVGLQYRLWVGEGSIAHVTRLNQQIQQQEQENSRLQLQNDRLAAEVRALKDGYAAIEAKAREELGFVKKDETFFLVVDRADKQETSQSSGAD